MTRLEEARRLAWAVKREILRRQLERTARVFAEQADRPPERDRQVAEKLVQEFREKGEL